MSVICEIRCIKIDLRGLGQRSVNVEKVTIIRIIVGDGRMNHDQY